MSKPLDHVYRRSLDEVRPTRRELEQENERLMAEIERLRRLLGQEQQHARAEAYRRVVRVLQPMACTSEDALYLLGVVEELLKKEETDGTF